MSESEFRTIPGHGNYEINRAGVVRRRVASASGRYPVGFTLRPVGGQFQLERRSRIRVSEILKVVFDWGIDDVTHSELIGEEKWLPVVGYEGWYDVSDAGRVRRVAHGLGTRPGKVLKPFIASRVFRGRGVSRRWDGTGKGDCYVGLHRDGRSVRCLVSRLVCGAFHGAPQGPMEANHKNGDTLDNRAANLEWTTASSNVRHALATGIRKPHHANGKFTDAAIRDIRRSAGVESATATARRYHVGLNTIRRIQTGKVYRHVS